MDIFLKKPTGVSNTLRAIEKYLIRESRIQQASDQFILPVRGHINKPLGMTFAA